MPIIVCENAKDAYYERDSKMVKWDLVELIHFLRGDGWPRGDTGRRRALPIMLVTLDPHRVLLRVHEEFKSDPEWQVRLNVSDQSNGNVRVFSQDNLYVRLFGFRTPVRNTRYFHPISPLHFMSDFRDYGDPDWPEWLRLYKWAAEIRKWIWDNKMRFSPTRGGLSAQLLRDERFYPDIRRKVPTFLNEEVREALPGNFYATVQRDGTMFGSVYVIDQENAHHYAAETVNLPDANLLEARGRHRTAEDGPYADRKDPIFDITLQEHGLLRLRVFVPKSLMGALPPWATRGELHNIYLYTNELPLLRALGVEIRHISRAWTSPTKDTGLALLARWAQAQVRERPGAKQWLKPTLLSAYGILGVKPHYMESAYWRTNKGIEEKYAFGPHLLTLQQIKGSTPFQSPIANVIHRGMIEAETRRLSIEMARSLESQNHKVISIHADAVIVQDEGQQLPLLPPPWRVKHQLTQFKIIDKVSFESEALTILPGRRRKG